MLSRRFGLAALVCAVLFCPLSLPAAGPEELRELQQEIIEAQRSIDLLVRQLQLLERRLDSLREMPSQPDEVPSALNDAWRMLTGREVTAITFGEFGNGKVTIALYDSQKQLTVLRKQGDEWLAPWSTTLDATSVPRILVKDLNGDSEDEIILATNELAIYRRFEDAYEVVWDSLESFHPSPAPRVEVADFNKDGRLDLAVLNWQDDQKVEDERGETLYLYTRTLSRIMEFGLTDVVSLRDEEGYEASAGLVVADLLGDESPEIVVGNDNGHLWLGTVESGRVKFDRNWKIPGGGAIGAGLAAGDVFGDSSPELLVATNGGELFVFGIDDDIRPQLLAGSKAGPLPYGLSAADLDGEGKAEIVLSRGLLDYSGLTQKDVVIEAWQMRGESSLERVWKKETANVPRHVAVDLNQDGRSELLVFSANGSQPIIMELRWGGRDEVRPNLRSREDRVRDPDFSPAPTYDRKLRDELDDLRGQSPRRDAFPQPYFDSPPRPDELRNAPTYDPPLPRDERPVPRPRIDDFQRSKEDSSMFQNPLPDFRGAAVSEPFQVRKYTYRTRLSPAELAEALARFAPSEEHVNLNVPPGSLTAR